MSELFNDRTIIPGQETEAVVIERQFNHDVGLLRAKGYPKRRALDTAFRMNFILLRRVLDFDILEAMRTERPEPKQPYRNPRKQKSHV